MGLFFYELQNKLKKERKEKLSILMSQQTKLSSIMEQLKLDKPSSVDNLINLSCDGKLNLPSEEISLHLLECLSQYIILVRGVIKSSVNLTEELDRYQDIQEKAFAEHGDEIRVLKEPEELVKKEINVMDDMKVIYDEIKILLNNFIDKSSIISPLYVEYLIIDMISEKKIIKLSPEDLSRLLYLILTLLKKWLVIMITTFDRAFVLESLIIANDIEIAEFMELKELLKEADDKRFSDFMNQLMESE